MAGVLRWQDGRFSSEVAEKCGVEDLSVKLRQTEMVWTYEKGSRGGCWVR